MVAIRSKNKLEFYDGTLIYLDELNRPSIVLDRCNTMVMTWIMNSIEGEIA